MNISNPEPLVMGPSTGQEWEIVKLSARYSSPEALREWNSEVKNNRPIYVAQCWQENHVLAKVYETKKGLILDLPETKFELENSVFKHLGHWLMKNEKAGLKPASVADMSRMFWDEYSKGVRCKRMVVPLDSLSEDMLNVHVPLMCTCSFSFSLTFKDLQHKHGHETLRNSFPQHKRRNTVSEIASWYTGAYLMSEYENLRHKGLRGDELSEQFTEFNKTHIDEVRKKAENIGEELFNQHWINPLA